MCLILVAVQARSASRFLLLANRDEFHSRASAAMAPWSEDPRVLGGRDLVAGGSWMAVRADGRFAAVTNLRNGPPKPAPRSRGELVSGFVLGEESAQAWLEALLRRVDQYAPFNLVLGDASGLYAFDGGERSLRPLEPGLHTISNGPLDEDWPKRRRLRESVAVALASGVDDAALLALLRDPQPAPDDELPDTGFDLERERLLSPIFVAGTEYGTRASTFVEVREDGALRAVEQRFGPDGVPQGRSVWMLRSRCWEYGPEA